QLKLNPAKCAFGVQAGQFLGFLVHRRGIEIDQNKSSAIEKLRYPSSKKELQSFLGKVNYLRRFIANVAGKTKVFSPLLRLKNGSSFEWKDEHSQAFDQIKQYLMKAPLIAPPDYKLPFRLYVSAAQETIGGMLAQEDENHCERVIYYLSRFLSPVECRYSAGEKLGLALYYAVTKLRHYIGRSTVFVLARSNVIKYLLGGSLLSGRLSKWSLYLSPFDLRYVPLKAMKGQVVADFLAEHSGELCDESDPCHWTLFFDGSRTAKGAGIGLVICSPEGNKWRFAFKLVGEFTNNSAEYEALLRGMETLSNMGAQRVMIKGDSQLVINHMTGESKCKSPTLSRYVLAAQNWGQKFEELNFLHVTRSENKEANDLAQFASGFTKNAEILKEIGEEVPEV
ncbi:RNase H-like domain-containing protein, partial [Haemophilus sp. SZY H57]